MTARRPLVPLLVAVVGIVVILVAGGIAIRTSISSSFARGQQIRAVRTLLFGVIEAQLNEETGLRGYAATGDPLFLEPFAAGRVALPSVYPQLTEHLSELGMADGLTALRQARAINRAWIETVAAPILRNRHQHQLQLERRGKVLVDQFRLALTTIQVGLDQQYQSLENTYQRDLNWLGFVITAGAVLFLATGLLFAAAQTRAWDRIDAERRHRQEVTMREHEARLRERGLRAAYEAEKRVADTLQEAFSQKQLPATPAVSFSATYVPATDEARVGGDWYDAFDIGDNRILFSIGDIAGHGLSASVAMSRVRDEMLSGALMDLNAESILARVNQRILTHGHPAPMATAIVGIADAQKYEFVYATAGHPPPVLVEPGRPARLLEFGGLPLGVSEKSSYRTRSVQTVPGARFILYTDGVIEHTRDILEGERLLLKAVDDTSTADDVAEAIYRTIFRDNTASDDVAILTIGFSVNHRLGLTVSAEGSSTSFSGEVRGTGPAQSGAALAGRVLGRAS